MTWHENLKIDRLLERMWPSGQSNLQRSPNLRSVIVSLCATGVIIVVLYYLTDTPFVAAVCIFFVAFVCFSVVAVLKRESAAWRYVDYPWVFATLVSVLIALTANVSSVNFSNVAKARHEFRASISGVIFQLEASLDRYCGSDPTAKGPGPGDLYSCPRMRHMLYQAHGDFRIETLEEVTSRKMPQNWASNFCLIQSVPGHEQWNINSEQGPLCRPKRDFENAKTKIDQAFAHYDANTTFLDRALKSGGIKYWYFVYAILAALRLSRVTADILPRP